jgi:predicted Ser/Thr protein kinase
MSERRSSSPDGRDLNGHNLVSSHEGTVSHEFPGAISFEQYLRLADIGEVTIPRNAYDFVYTSTMKKGCIVLPSGLMEYKFFSEHPTSPLYGLNGSIDSIVSYELTGVETGGKNTALILVGNSGSGKNAIVNAIKAGVETHTRELAYPVYAICGCPIQESPLNLIHHVLSTDEVDKYKVKYNTEIRPICSDCEERLERVNGDVTNILVAPRRFSVSSMKGIAKLDPVTTSYTDPEGRDIIAQTILKSNGGILEIAEAGLHDINFLRKLADLLRGRELIYKGRQYTIDTFIILHTTTPEFEKLAKNDSMQSFLSRLVVVKMPYNLSSPDESKIHEKGLREGGLQFAINEKDKEANLPHISHRTIEVFAEYAALTRLSKIVKDDLWWKLGFRTTTDKLKFYKGQAIGNGVIITPDDARNLIEFELYKGTEGDGMFGLSPVVIQNIVVAEVSKSKSTIGCLDPVSVYDIIVRRLEKGTDLIRKDAVDEIKTALKYGINIWVRNILRIAYDSRYDQRRTNAVNEYLANFVLYNSNGTRLGPDGSQQGKALIESDLVKIESKGFPNGYGTEGIHQHRSKLSGLIIKLRENGMAINYESLPEWLQNGIDETIFDKGKIKLLIDSFGEPSASLDSQNNLKQIENNLLQLHGMCECCVPKIVQYAKANGIFD